MTDDSNFIIHFSCPACKSKGTLDVKKDTIQHSPRGISTINVEENFICKHSFVIYVDRNLQVRDSFICDFKIQLPIIVMDYDISSLLAENHYDLDIIKINLIPSILASILRAIYFGKQIVYVSNDNFLNEHFKNFFNSILKDIFKPNLEFIKKAEYLSNKKEYKQHVVFSGNNIINDKDHIFNSKKSIIENIIIQKFYGERDNKSSLILLSNENVKVYKLSNAIKDFIENSRENLDIKKLMDYLKQKYNNIKVLPDYLNFLFDIVEHHFKVKIPISLKITSKLLL